MSLLVNYTQAQLLLEKHELFISPAELHGIITGLIASGVEMEGDEFEQILSDFLNDGMGFSKELKTYISDLYISVTQKLIDTELHFEAFLPDEDESLSDQAGALVNWVGGFLLGFGIKQTKLNDLSEDVREVIRDFTEITRLDTDFDDTEEDEQALTEVIEFVRVSAMLCFSELGRFNKDSNQEPKTIH